MAAITLRTHRVEFFFSNMVMLGTIRSKMLRWVKHSESRNAENQQKMGYLRLSSGTVSDKPI